jgi:hypothetical protein
MAHSVILCYVVPQSQVLSDGLERVELYISRDDDGVVARPEPGTRLDVIVRTATKTYIGGVRSYREGNQVYLCGDLYREGNGGLREPGTDT